MNYCEEKEVSFQTEFSSKFEDKYDLIISDLLAKASAMLAHEIKNPLGSISLFTSLLQEDLKDKKESLEMLLHIQKSINTIDIVLKNFLTFTRLSKLDLKPLNIHSLIQEQIEVISNFFTINKPQATFEGNPFLYGNEDALRQVIFNLIKNAAEATDYKGKLEVFVEDINQDSNFAKDSVLIKVKDNGPGIDNNIKESIFEPFYTNKKNGSGLGLSIVKHIIKKHGGTIDVYTSTNILNHGTTFLFTLLRNHNNLSF